ncbi:unnamed protein product [Arabidopsis thaliana]|jgi:hypothetical protein|uniref:Uncharacterized mitochondrial protein AtMg01300 n=5 Tax=Arabidopsis TaxID=3701 RepID=M1300_ARATH|nr:uncharacterized protein AT2G07692 [Arabidopsis thaliana]P92561.1 RecName: Full=Uncharacterized mitochondrial protein AtMg01300; AltName: Full=ORF136a [Arabidopsis thaliana]KAG7529250.1 hypothetical protein ISN45_Un97g000310 [Arabidopsis thaliana x Arabidopsis arenosa]KAG7529344.1 hypothetical protein ISN44_Un143g000350 [Arabidopsis suecica]AAM15493.1 hypothetical protein [Arabidopsis thaliana]ABR46229.1 At2g07692 [Arabidopsis thaliana]AEC06081.1 hypothetical protein AT2G07692 [Arabidopsis |eukprot:NP_178784.1 hypothetical protein AT2G07692 [Arabidopsis thaliana]
MPRTELILNAAVILYTMIPPDAHSLGSEGRVVNGNWRDTSDVKEGSLPREVTKQVNGSLSSRTKQVNEFSKHTRFLVDISFSCCSLINRSLWESAQKDELSDSFGKALTTKPECLAVRETPRNFRRNLCLVIPSLN